MKQLIYRHLSEDAKRQICAWNYDGEYAIYNLPSYEEMQTRQMGFMHPDAAKYYYGFWDNTTLVGYIKITKKNADVSIGIGVKPDLCGKQYGQQILSMACTIAQTQYPGKPLCLEVRTWNTRAIKCYEKAGFRIGGQPYELTTKIGSGTFYRMVKDSPIPTNKGAKE